MNDGSLTDLLKWLWAAIFAPALWFLWSLLSGRIGKLENDIVPREEVERREEARDGQYLMLRQDVKELFTRDDHLKDHINSKIDKLRDDLHGEFSRLFEELRKAR